MNKAMRVTKSALVLGSFFVVAASCTSQVGIDQEKVSAFAPKPSNLRLNLTDAPNDDLTSVVVNIDRVELALTKGGKGARVPVAADLGEVDLLTLQDGKILPMHDLDLEEGIEVRQIRLILKDDGHFAVKKNGEICPLKTPSAQQSGLKLKLSAPVVIKSGHSYSLTVDFDAKKSVVQRGRGDCLLKPVLRVYSFAELPQDQVGEDGSTDQPGEELVEGGEDGATGGDDGASDGDGSSDGTGGDGTTGDGGDSTTGDGDAVPPGDGSGDGSGGDTTGDGMGTGDSGSGDDGTTEPLPDGAIDPEDPSTWPEVPEEDMEWYF